MAKLADRSENALNETRMLVLGAQVLIGFDYQAVFHPGFERLPPEAQHLKLLGLGLMLVALGLLIAPGAFHQIVEGGHDSERLIAYTGRVAASALLPFALGIGIEVYVAALAVLSPPLALPLGLAALVFALFFWYGLDWIWREAAGGQDREEKDMPDPKGTPLETRIKQVLTETRVVLPGAQALLGFQLTAVLTEAFGTLPKTSQYIHLAGLCLMAITIVFLMAPAAFHRIVERGGDTERLHRFASTMLLLAMVPLALGVAADFYIVLDKVLGSTGLALGIAGASLVFLYGLWFGLTIVLRNRHQGEGSPLRISRAVR